MSTITNKEALLNVALSKQKEIIRHQYTQDEMNALHVAIAQNLIHLNDLDDELKDIKETFKAKTSPLEKGNRSLLRNIKNGFIDQEIEVYLVPDYENKIIEFFDERGDKVGERRMMISELQGKLNF
jgi:hypothetical protein